MSISIAIASDHRGVALKDLLSAHLEHKRYTVKDFGCFNEDAVDYPDFAKLVTEAIVSHHQQIGILVCGSGIGMCIAANRNPKIRAALCLNAEYARLAREHNDANVIVFGANFISASQAIDSLEAFLGAKFKAGHYQQRVNKLS